MATNPGHSSRPETRRLVVPVIWFAFIVLVGFSAGRLLSACSINKDGWPDFLKKITSTECYDPVIDLVSANSAIRAFESDIHRKQMIIAAKIAQCGINCPPPQPQKTEGDRVREIAKQRGASAGRLQVTLAWNTKDDLDLEVACPSGRVGRRVSAENLRKCSYGKLNLDANDGSIGRIDNPVENISFESALPPGAFAVNIAHYRKASDASDPWVDYTLTVKLDDEERTCKGRIQYDSLRTFVRPIRFEAKLPLPECAPEIMPTKRCTESHCSKE